MGEKKLLILVAVFLVLTLFLFENVLAVTILLSDQGSEVKNSTGGLLESGDLTITIYDDPTGGNLIYDNTFNGAIINGSWNLQISTELEYGKSYWKDYAINGDNLNFSGAERLEFHSPLGLINNVSFINFSLIDSCSSGSSIRQIYANGSVICEADDSGGTGSSKGTAGFYLYNDSSLIYFNETQLNNTIDARNSGGGGVNESLWANDSTSTFLKSNYPQNINTVGNLSLGDKIIFTFGELIDNLVNGWVRITGGLNVTENVTVEGTSLKVSGKEVCLEDGTNCPSGVSDTQKTTAGIYLYNDTNTIYFNETELNDTIDSRENDTLGDVGACGNEQVVKWNTTSSSWYCSDVSGAGAGDIDAVNTNGDYLTGGVTSGTADLLLNETKLNETIDARASGGTDTQKTTSGIYLYNDTNTIYFNETELNDTIDARAVGGGASNWNVSGNNLFPKDLDYNVGIGTNAPNTELHVIGSGKFINTSGDTFIYLGEQDSGNKFGWLKWDESDESINLGTDTVGDILHVSELGYVGIGINPQNYRLQMNNPDDGSAVFVQLTNTDTGTTDTDGSYFGISGAEAFGFWNYENDYMYFGTNNDEVVRFHASGGFSFGDNYVSTDPGVDNMIIEGNVGIGTISPQQKLNVIGSANITGSLIVNETNVCLEDGTNCPSGGTDTQKTTAGIYLYNDTNTIYFNETELNDTIDARAVGGGASNWNISGNNLFPKDLDYNVGIGTSTPTSLLDLIGSTISRASLRIRNGLMPTTQNEGDIWVNDSKLYFYDGNSSINLLEGKKSGVIEGGEVAINADNTKFDISSGKGVLIDYTNPDKPIVANVIWDDITGIDSAFLTSDVGTFVGINASGDIIQQVQDFEREQLNSILRLGRLAHFNQATITNTFNFPLTIETDLDFAEHVMKRGTIKLSGLEIEANTTNDDLSLNRLEGRSMRIGAGADRSNINFPYSPLSTNFNFIPAWRDSDNTAVLSGATNQLNFSVYDENGDGTLTQANSGRYVNVYLYFFPYLEGQTVFQIYGHNEHLSLQGAIDKAGTIDDFYVPTDIRGGVLLASISAKTEVTNLTNAIEVGDARIVLSDNEGEINPPTSNLETTVNVNSEIDLPAPVNGVITLSPSTTYQCGGSSIPLTLTSVLNFSHGSRMSYCYITMTKGFEFNRRAQVEDSVITYIGNGTLFYGADTGDGIIRLLRNTIYRTSGNATDSLNFNISSTNPNGLVIMDELAIINPNDIDNQVKMGTIKGASIIMEKLRSYYFADGFELINNYAGINIEKSEMTNGLNISDSIFIDISGISSQIVVSGLYAKPKNQEYVFYISPSLTYDSITISNNPVSLTEFGANRSNLFFNDSLTQETIGVKTSGNVNIPDSATVGYMYFNGGDSLTPIPSLSTPVKINATWINKENERFDFNSTGKWTYTGIERKNTEIKATIVLDPQKDNANIAFNVYIAKNGVPVNDSVSSLEVVAGGIAAFNTWTKESINTGDYFEVYVSRETSLEGAYIIDGRFMIDA
ncbi:hypothetical protein ACFLZF_00405 [Nanoarchaeota archaeon]